MRSRTLDVERADDWDIFVVRRHRAPPLRFAGRVICCCTDRDLVVRIWRARSGGFMLSHSVDSPGAEDGSRYADAEELMLALEAYCRTIEASGDVSADLQRGGQLHVADLVEEMARRMEWRRRFLALAGRTLDAFEARLRDHEPEHAGVNG